MIRPGTRASVVFVWTLGLGCSREQATFGAGGKPGTTTDGSASVLERPCHLMVGGPSSVMVPLASEVGQKIEIVRGTPCVVLDAAPALTRVRITDGPYKGTVGWAQSGTVADGKPAP
jgi:hypothetical protein